MAGPEFSHAIYLTSIFLLLSSTTGQQREDNMYEEFKQFVLRGNVVDLAVGVVIGVAFAAVVDSLVADIITPIIAMVGGEPDFTALDFSINDAQFRYGAFITAVLSFLIIAAVVFFLVVVPMNQLMNRLKREEESPKETPEDIMLLREIRDSLRSR
jgi:large conductance mechanosensitive channel